MGVIRPPWVSKDWFAKCPFNYCDHFGDKLMLAQICKICIEEVNKKSLQEETDRNLIEMKHVQHNIARDLAKTIALLSEQAYETKIDLDKIFTKETSKIRDVDSYHFLLGKISQYGDLIEIIIDSLQTPPSGTDVNMVAKAIDALAHSRHYAYVKTRRAYSSKKDEDGSLSDEELQDSKTSAFYAYVATERNSRVLLTLAMHSPLHHLSNNLLHSVQMSLSISLMLKETFFPNEDMDYIEFGYDEFGQVNY